MSPVGRGCWELGSFDLRVRAKVQVGRLRVAELSPPGVRHQQLGSICQAGPE